MSSSVMPWKTVRQLTREHPLARPAGWVNAVGMPGFTEVADFLDHLSSE